MEWCKYALPMAVSLHKLARSRCLRVMGVFAWLMLATTSLAAAPANMDMSATHATQAAAASTSDACHDAMPASTPAIPDHHRPDCCGGQTSVVCHCAAMCASVVPAQIRMIVASSVRPNYDRRADIDAPTPARASPLRPPSA